VVLAFDGVSVIDPRHLPFNKLPPPVHIEQITADRKTYETSSNLRLPRWSRSGDRLYTLSAWSRRRRTVFASSWKAAIPTGRTWAMNGRRSITIFLRATTASA
jgi:hypothetical protein